MSGSTCLSVSGASGSLSTIAITGSTKMNMSELNRALRTLRLSGMADSLEARLVQAQSDKTAHVDFLSTLVRDELVRRQDRLLSRRIKDAAFRDRDKTLDAFDFDFNK